MTPPTGIVLTDPTARHALRVGTSVLYYARPSAEARWRINAAVNAVTGPDARLAAVNGALLREGIRGWAAIEDPTGQVPTDHDPDGPAPDPVIVADLVTRLGPLVAGELLDRLTELYMAEATLLGNSETGASSAGSTPA
jgi:hypothetical protein